MDTGLPLDKALRAVGELLVRREQNAYLIYFKLYAATDDIGPASRHFTDLLALGPTADELGAARTWITDTQDPSPAMALALEAVTTRVRAASR